MEELVCGKTPDELRALKSKHGHVFVVEVREEDRIFRAVCKEPDMQVIDASQAVGRTSEAKGAMALYDNCVVLADEDIRRRDMLKLQVAAAIGEKISRLEATVKNV